MDLVQLTWTPPLYVDYVFFTIVLSLFSKGHYSTLHIYYGSIYTNKQEQLTKSLLGSIYTNKQGKSFSYSRERNRVPFRVPGSPKGTLLLKGSPKGPLIVKNPPFFEE